MSFFNNFIAFGCFIVASLIGIALLGFILKIQWTMFQIGWRAL